MDLKNLIDIGILVSQQRDINKEIYDGMKNVAVTYVGLFSGRYKY